MKYSKLFVPEFFSICVLQKVFEIHADVDSVCEHVQTRRRAERAPVAEYLLSRSVAGKTMPVNAPTLWLENCERHAADLFYTPKVLYFDLQLMIYRTFFVKNFEEMI